MAVVIKQPYVTQSKHYLPLYSTLPFRAELVHLPSHLHRFPPKRRRQHALRRQGTQLDVCIRADGPIPGGVFYHSGFIPRKEGVRGKGVFRFKIQGGPRVPLRSTLLGCCRAPLCGEDRRGMHVKGAEGKWRFACRGGIGDVEPFESHVYRHVYRDCHAVPRRQGR